MDMTELLVRRDKLAETEVRTGPLPAPADGEIVVAIDKFALTANNVSYAVTGDMIGYWRFFPADLPWGKVPVWGFGDVVASACADIAVGERLYGFFPIASHVVLQPGRVSARAFTDVAAHRADLPGLYNVYARTGGEPAEMRAFEDSRCLFFPLFATSFVLYDYLLDNGWFGAGAVVILSASSKTALGLANMLARHQGARPRIIGLTSAGNVAFVETLGTYDEIVTYDAIGTLDAAQNVALVDMSGNGGLVAQLHHHFGDHVKLSCSVGATHWDQRRGGGALPGAKPAFFFAPTQIAKREADWGAGEIMRRAMAASMRMAAETAPHIQITHAAGADAVQHAFARTVAGGVAPREALILSLRGAGG